MTSTPARPDSAQTGPSRRVLLERKLRRRSLRWVLRARALDRRPRKNPDFIVAGAQKAGSTSLFAYLAAHPDVDQPLVKEVNYFDLWAHRGHDWYGRHFPVARDDGRQTGEASPMYMVHPLAMARIARDLPDVKIVVILREPVSRLVSHYRHSVRLEHEHLSLRDALDAEDERVGAELEALKRDPFHQAWALQKFNYAGRSLYLEQVQQILSLFPGRALFVRLEDLTEVDAVRPLCEFLGLRFDPLVPFEAHNVNRKVPAPAEDLIPAELLERLRRDARATCDLLGWEPWEE